MATPGQLIKTVAGILGMEEVTVASHYRHLREAGLVAKSGRGSGAAKMTPADCAHLLIAITGSDLAKNAADTVATYGALKASGGALYPSGGILPTKPILQDPDAFWKIGSVDIPKLKDLRPRHTLKELLVALIEAAADGQLEDAASEDPWPGRTLPLIDLSLVSPAPKSLVSVRTANHQQEMFYLSATRSTLKKLSTDTEPSLPRQLAGYDTRGGDLRTTKSFGEQTLLAIGKLLADRVNVPRERPRAARSGKRAAKSVP